jgi:hypothetical protein
MAVRGAWPKPSFYKLRSSPQYQPFLLICFWYWPAGQELTATLDMRVNRGTVRISATGTPWEIRLSRGARVHPEIKVTPAAWTDQPEAGFGNVLIGRLPDDSEYGFYWYGVDVRPS